jgi:hypothetical protein
MDRKYYIPLARNSVTKVTVKGQDLHGYFERDQQLALHQAQRLADQMNSRGGPGVWTARVELHSHVERRS